MKECVCVCVCVLVVCTEATCLLVLPCDECDIFLGGCYFLLVSFTSRCFSQLILPFQSYLSDFQQIHTKPDGTSTVFQYGRFNCCFLKSVGWENLTSATREYFGVIPIISNRISHHAKSPLCSPTTIAKSVLLARTADTHTCTHNVALGASDIHPTLYVKQPRLLAVLTY
jgi:hypothetical protein